MALHLLKLAVGIDGVDHLRRVQAARLARTGRLIHVTRYRPRRAEEILAGGSMYWVVRHRIRVRQRIVGLDRHETAAGGKPKCAIVLDPALIATDPVHRRRTRAGAIWRPRMRRAISARPVRSRCPKNRSRPRWPPS